MYGRGEVGGIRHAHLNINASQPRAISGIHFLRARGVLSERETEKDEIWAEGFPHFGH